MSNVQSNSSLIYFSRQVCEFISEGNCFDQKGFLCRDRKKQSSFRDDGIVCFHQNRVFKSRVHSIIVSVLSFSFHLFLRKVCELCVLTETFVYFRPRICCEFIFEKFVVVLLFRNIIF